MFTVQHLKPTRVTPLVCDVVAVCVNVSVAAGSSIMEGRNHGG